MASVDSVVCRICSSEVLNIHSLALFSAKSVKADIPGRLSRLAEIPVQKSDGFSKYLCRGCKNKFLSLESDLQEFRTKAQSTCSPRQAEPFSRKSQKDTSGQGVSPNTAAGRPRPKRAVGRVLFPGQENIVTSDKQGKSIAV